MWWRTTIRALGVAVVAFSLLRATIGMLARMDTAGERWEFYEIDVEIGASITVGVLLLGVPPQGRSSARWWVQVGLGAFLAGAVVGGGLAWTHYEQYVIRSAPRDMTP